MASDLLYEQIEKLTAERDSLRAEILLTRGEAVELTKTRDPNINSALRDLGRVRVERDEARAALAMAEHAKINLAGTLCFHRDRADAAEAQVAALRAALEDVWAAIGDRLLARGPLSKEYAGSVTAKVTAALAAPDPSAWVRREELEAVTSAMRGMAASRVKRTEAKSERTKRDLADLATARALLERARVYLGSIFHSEACLMAATGSTCTCGLDARRALAAEIGEALAHE